MKAGIYKTPNGNLVYVAKDRSIKAATLRPSTWPVMKVCHRSKDDTVEFLGYRCTRVADVPNGCTDHRQALEDFIMVAEVEATLAMRETEDPAVKPPVDLYNTAMEDGIADAERVIPREDRRYRADNEGFAPWAMRGWRLCGKQSAHKHRKQGHEVRWFPGFGRAWR